MLVGHFVLMVWHALLVSLFFGHLWKPRSEGRRRFVVKMFLILTLGGVALGWLMYPFP